MEKHRCSYHKLGDLSTTLEMTVLFFSRHFDQVKRVEKSPKAKQYYRLSSTPTVIQRVFNARRIPWKGHHNTTVLPSIGKVLYGTRKTAI